MSEIVAVKALTTTLCVFQLSTTEVVYQALHHVGLLKEMSTRWKAVEVGTRTGAELRRMRSRAACARGLPSSRASRTS